MQMQHEMPMQRGGGLRLSLGGQKVCVCVHCRRDREQRWLATYTHLPYWHIANDCATTYLHVKFYIGPLLTDIPPFKPKPNLILTYLPYTHTTNRARSSSWRPRTSQWVTRRRRGRWRRAPCSTKSVATCTCIYRRICLDYNTWASLVLRVLHVRCEEHSHRPLVCTN